MASTPSRSVTLLALAVLAAVLWWLVSPRLVAEDLGPATAVVGRPGVPTYLLRREAGWELLPAAGGAPLATLSGLTGVPALASDGSLLAESEAGLVAVSAAGVSGPGPALPVDLGPGPWALSGLDGQDLPVLVGGPDDGRRIAVRDADGDGWRLVSASSGAAAPPAGEPLVLAPTRRALAFRGAGGWEVWSFGGATHTRLVAEDCRRPAAVFSPDGALLIVDGRWDGLFRVELDQRRVSFMAQGNLGRSPSLPFAAGFRGDPLMLVSGQRGLDGHLQITQTHLAGQGRAALTTGAVHHYAPVVAAGGRFVAYRLADDARDEAASGRERLHLFDFLHGRSVFELERQALGLDAGPTFVGDRATLIVLAEGHAWCVDAPVD